ncbi:hypothetical protein pdam_00011204, partial [Pocillopora damicornis]
LCHSHSHCPSFLPHAALSPRRVLQAQKKGQNGAAESLRELFRAQLNRHQHLAAVLLECVPKSHPDQQRRRRMAQRAQPTGAGKKSASPVHADPAASRREPLNDPPNTNGFGAQTMQTSATNLRAAASKGLQSVGSVRER